jgi:formylglycine-generating enzyme required for sulfatase activity
MTASTDIAPPATADPAPAERPGMEWIRGGTFKMGSDRHYPEEGPAHEVTVDGFWIDRTPVTNADFRRFVEATGHVTLAERAPNPADYPGARPEMLVPASVVFVKPAGPVDLRNHYNWWALVPGADWRHPLGPESSLDGRDDHPVVQVAYEDAAAFARWAGKKLPTEAEFEYAARGGLGDAEFAWGDELSPGGQMMANTWQGQFPYENLAADGYEGTSPFGAFPPNGYGLLDMIGNVWEWTTDWYGARHQAKVHGCCEMVNPRGGARADSFDPREPLKIPRKVMKGGSFLCAPNYCRRYRPAARMAQAIDTATCHLGFRCVVRV